MFIAKTLKIIGRIVLALLLIVYVSVALLNYSAVQSILGSAIGSHYSKEWGGVVKVGSVHVDPFNHLLLRNVLLVSPDNDTILDAERIACRFKGLPLKDGGISMRSVSIRNTTFHLTAVNQTTSFTYIAKYFKAHNKRKEPKVKGEHTPFVVAIDEVRLNNVCYRMTLDTIDYYANRPHSVDVSNMVMDSINAKFTHLRVVDASVLCKIVYMSTVERSGWRMRKLSGDVDVSGKGICVNNMILQTDSMNMVADVNLLCDSWASMDKWCDSVDMDVLFKPGTILSLYDAAYWAPSLWGCDSRIRVTGHVKGPVADLHVEDFNVSFGKYTRLYFDGSVSGLPYIDNTMFDVHVHQFRTNYDDYSRVHYPGTLDLGDVAPLLRELGSIDLSCDFLGGADRCFADLNLHTSLGSVEGSAQATRNPKTEATLYKVNLKSDRVTLPSLLKNRWVSCSGFDIAAEGQLRKNDDPSLLVDAKLYNTSLNGNSIDHTVLKGSLRKRQANVELAIKDDVINLDAQGSAAFPREGDNVYALDLNLADIDLQRLHLWEDDSISRLSSDVHVALSGNIAKNPQGSVQLLNTRLQRDNGSMEVRSIDIALDEDNGQKSLSLSSDIANLNLRGYYEYSSLPLIVKKMLCDYSPQYWKSRAPGNTFLTDEEQQAVAASSLEIDLRWKDHDNQMALLLPKFSIAEETTLSGVYNPHESLRLVLRSDSLKYGSLALYGIGLTSGGYGERYRALLDVSRLDVSSKGVMDDLRLRAASSNSGASLALAWDALLGDTSSHGDLSLALLSDEYQNVINIEKSDFYVNGEKWTVDKNGDLSIRDKHITVEDVTISNDEQQLKLRYLSAPDIEDYAEAHFSQFQLAQLTDLLLVNSGLSFAGKVDGTANVKWSEGSTTPLVKANLLVDSCHVNGHDMGLLNMRTYWDAPNKSMNLFVTTDLNELNGLTHPLQASGRLLLGGEAPEMDFVVDFDRFDLQSVEPLLKSFSSRFEGFLTGELNVAGTFSDPHIVGKAWVQNGLININATNVDYLFDDTISLARNRITLNRFHLRDVNDNNAFISGTIDYHDGFQDFAIDLSVASDKLMVFNTKASGNNAYGTIFTSLHGSVVGPLNDLNIAARASTQKGSKLTIPVNSQRNISSADYIIFVSDEQYGRRPDIKQRKRSTVSSNIGLDLVITPDLQLSLPVDLSGVSVDIDATGNGALRVDLEPQRDPQIVGDYNIASGSLNLSLLSVLSKDFKIEEGSSLEFSGDLNSTRLDVNAIYSQRVELSSLTGSMGDEIAKKPIPVESVVSLAGTLQAPTVNFDIRLPNADQSVQDEVFAYIDRTNERDMLNQTVYLLLRGKFYSNNAEVSTGTTDVAGSGYAVVANSLGSVVSSMIDFVDIDFDYSAATDLRSEQFSVGINKQWNKFYLESTFGYGGYDRELSSDEALANNLVGDMLLGYKMNNRLHFFVFNRSNTNDYTRHELPYKQGLGLKYTRDFDKWKDLFTPKTKSPKQKSAKSKKSNKKKQTEVQQ
ncbi:MAG: translocation/assembly module TamB domain-containing protein [Bacteroidales bacterium]|nr:translocation/assembly module TamB domain-containing protein [Bacteroidales bacterium]